MFLIWELALNVDLHVSALIKLNMLLNQPSTAYFNAAFGAADYSIV